MRKAVAAVVGATMLASGAVPVLMSAAQAAGGQDRGGEAPRADAPRPPHADRGARGPQPGGQAQPQAQPQRQAPAPMAGGVQASSGGQGYRGPQGDPRGGFDRGSRPDGQRFDGQRFGGQRFGGQPFAGQPSPAGGGTPEGVGRPGIDPRAGGYRGDGHLGGYAPGGRGGPENAGRPGGPGYGYGQDRGQGRPAYANPGAPRPVYGSPRPGYADPGRGGYAGRPGYGDQARFADRADWNRGWRQDGRFDWNGYRNGHRGLFSLPRYAAPRGFGYGYRRFAIGFALDAPLYSPGYWISDPWAYRLPPAYGDLRWVRYYGDALLVDLDTGEVVDTVYGIFY